MNGQSPKRVRRSQAQWQELIETQQACGLSAMAFCKEQNIGYASFCKWRNRLSDFSGAENVNSNGDKGFIDLTSLQSSDTGRWQIVLKLGDGMELELTRH